MNKKLVGIALAAMLSIILIESYFLFTQPKQTVYVGSKKLDSSSQSPFSEDTSNGTSPSTKSITPNGTTATLNPTLINLVSEPNISIPKPSVPEFTIECIDKSYDVQPTNGIDQYTGQNVTITAGYRVDKRMVKFTITNQLFTAYRDASGNNISLYYNFRFKGHYGNEWDYYPFKPDGQSTIPYGMLTGLISPKFPASTTEDTVVSIELSLLFGSVFPFQNIPSGSEVEFQVQALIGHIDQIHRGLIAGDFYNFAGEASDWSNSQTLLIPA